MTTDAQVLNQLRKAHEGQISAGNAMTPTKLDQQYQTFESRFGPHVLAGLDGEELLHRIHGRGSRESLAYWLEFKDDEEFEGRKFGSIAGGSALKFGVYYRKETETWMTGTAAKQRELTLAEAIDIARKQRDQLAAAAKILDRVGPSHPQITDYTALEKEIVESAPDVADSAWGHKYLSLLFPEQLDDFHVADYQSFHLVKCLKEPPQGGRYASAGEFVQIARELGLRLQAMASAMNGRHGAPHRYWRIGTQINSPRDQWAVMKQESCIAIGWDKIGDLSEIPHTKAGKEKIRELLDEHFPNTPSQTGKSREQVFRLLARIAEDDVVVAADGQTVLGIGRVRGEYRFASGADAPHRRPVEWLSLEEWKMPNKEALLSTCRPINKTENRIAIEKRLLGAGIVDRQGPNSKPVAMRLEGISGRIQSVLERKFQVILHGPPGTGKTFWAEHSARQLAASSWFSKTY